MPEPASSVERIAAEAVGIDSPEVREAYLDVACAGDSGLREQVDAEVARLDAERPTLSGVPAPAPVDLGFGRGDRVGRYRLIERLGEGGFGVVWRAEQTEPVRREVALKVIKPGMDSAAVLARFEAERQALAVMDHPCIAKVFDGGTTQRGLPYFVMEIVKGEPITEHCDRHRLSLDKRVELFVRVCEAVQHAHMKGVIHRDLKPSNILVEYEDNESTPKVIDFGVAKALNQRLTEATIFTERGQMIGTPEYMSPEQAEMNAQGIDTRTDVYSLGVVLYELLTGSRPFEAETLRRAGLAEIQRIIREVEPPRPSTRVSDLASSSADPTAATRIADARRTAIRTLQGVLRRDLDWVVLKCLQKDRTARYGSASYLADDLRRFLRGVPVEAGAPGLWDRLAKAHGRHAAPLRWAYSALLTMTLLMFVLTMLMAAQSYGRLSDAMAMDVLGFELGRIEGRALNPGPPDALDGVSREDQESAESMSREDWRAIVQPRLTTTLDPSGRHDTDPAYRQGLERDRASISSRWVNSGIAATGAPGVAIVIACMGVLAGGLGLIALERSTTLGALRRLPAVAAAVAAPLVAAFLFCRALNTGEWWPIIPPIGIAAAVYLYPPTTPQRYWVPRRCAIAASVIAAAVLCVACPALF